MILSPFLVCSRMIDLTRETEELARRLASIELLPVDVVVRQALEARAGTMGFAPAPVRG